jgi:DNA-directed RNA polymerase subunit RPC12/RpoP
MSWLTSAATTRLLDVMREEQEAITARDLLRAPFVHRCGTCGREAYRIEANAGAAIYVCDACGAQTVVSLIRGTEG